ncbi:CYTH domain-containing protein [Oscillospiraceae bacterium HV4-5-C5C]|nr:CYTH domain-containing protein [Oscillospiraceae bacterium HV4-5-C5C]
MEREVKLAAAPGYSFPTDLLYEDLTCLHNQLKELTTAEKLRIRAGYWDTPSLAVAQAGYSLRSRFMNDELVLTLKGPAPEAQLPEAVAEELSNRAVVTSSFSGLWLRQEYEAVLSTGSAGELVPPTEAELALLALPARLERWLNQLLPDLALHGQADFTRLVRLAAYEDLQVELALDKGQLLGLWGAEQIDELELELKNGPADKLNRLAADLLRTHPEWRPGTKSKAGRIAELNSSDVLIIGGGAAGLMAAQELLQDTAVSRIVLLEKTPCIAHKLLATGNGRANLSNRDLSLCHYHQVEPLPDWLETVLTPDHLHRPFEIFDRLGLALRAEDGRLYPYSMKSQTVSRLLQESLLNSRIKVVTGERVQGLLPYRGNADSHGWLVNGSQATYLARQVIWASGGQSGAGSYPDTAAYTSLTALGHHLTPLWPGLTPLCSPDVPEYMAGERVRGTLTLSACQSASPLRQSEGEVLFTAYGLSGICTMDLSFYCGKLLQEQRQPLLRLNVCPEYTEAQLYDHICQRRQRLPQAAAETALWGLLSEKLAVLVLSQALPELAQKLSPAANSPKLTHKSRRIKAKKTRRPELISRCGLTLQDLSRRQIQQIARQAFSLTFSISGDRGFEQSQITCGGIPSTEVKPQTLESVLAPHCYITGELLDISGDTGGYNLQMAFSTGCLAAAAARAALRARANEDKHEHDQT